MILTRIEWPSLIERAFWKRKDQGQVSIKTAVLLVNNLLQNRLVSVVAICRK